MPKAYEQCIKNGEKGGVVLVYVNAKTDAELKLKTDFVIAMVTSLKVFTNEVIQLHSHGKQSLKRRTDTASGRNTTRKGHAKRGGKAE